MSDPGDKSNKRARLTRKQRRDGQGKKAFDMSKYPQRHVALKIAYLGWNYHGFAAQQDTTNTIEEILLQALEKTCLIEGRETCNFVRGARTDKGVSAVGSVVSCRVRCRCTSGKGVIPPTDISNQPTEEPNDQQNSNDLSNELDYVLLLNRVLPSDIRCVSWSPVETSFNARFDATHRTYRYFFLNAGMDLDAMAKAGKLLVGEHDFRNFCKMDVVNVQHWVRRLFCVELRSIGRITLPGIEYEICEAEICGQAFLWHQIRCIMAVLFMVGNRHEQPDIVSYLLDPQNCTAKPVYNMAGERTLLLCDCAYNDMEWQTVSSHAWKSLHSITHTLHSACVDLALLSSMSHSLIPEHSAASATSLATAALFGCGEPHVPLKQRPREKSLEGKIDGLSGKKRSLCKALKGGRSVETSGTGDQE